MQETIAILMATYNGQKYLKQQIESVINQTYENIKIFISDDGSNDSTLDIIKGFQKKDDRIYLEYSEHSGACGNFKKLLNNHKDFKYIMFCDQDDVWETTKIEKTYEKMINCEKENPELPILVYCKKLFVDEELKKLNYEEKNYQDDLKTLLCQPHIYGCTMMMNRYLIERVEIPNYATMHDHWISLVAAREGKIVRLEEELIYYRQHSNNVTGGLGQFRLIDKFKNWKNINRLQKDAMVMCYLFCKTTNESKITNEYYKMFRIRKILRLFYAFKFKYKLDGFLATLRGLYNLMCLNIKEEENGF